MVMTTTNSTVPRRAAGKSVAIEPPRSASAVHPCARTQCGKSDKALRRRKSVQPHASSTEKQIALIVKEVQNTAVQRLGIPDGVVEARLHQLDGTGHVDGLLVAGVALHDILQMFQLGLRVATFNELKRTLGRREVAVRCDDVVA